MLITRQQLILILAIASLYFIGQIVAGTDTAIAVLFAVAILFGILAIFAGGGLRSALGCLNAILIAKFLLIGIAIKILLLQPADQTLDAPHTTALVMALGFGGVLVGTLIQSRLYCPQSWLINQLFSMPMLLSFSIVLFVVSYLGYFAGMIPATHGEGVQTGGWLGIARTLGSLKSLSIVPALIYLWRINTRRWMTHPIIIGMLGWSIVIGIFSTSKQDAIEPLVFYVFVGLLRYGWRDLRLWSIASLGLLYFAVIVFPYSQYVRDAGGRKGTFADRAEITEDVFWRMTSNQEFRSTITERVTKTNPYFNIGLLAPFSRLAMVSEADRLISTTEQQQAFTGWKTITWGFKLLTPSILYPDKPIAEAGNYLAHIAGDVGPSDEGTQVSYGIMANLYNAFSLFGVVIGTPVFFAGLYYWIRIFVGDARWDGMPTTSTLWFIWLIALFQHSIVESSLSGIMASLAFPLVIAFLCLLARCLCPFIPGKAVGA
jgi:hypothetical protein